VRTQIKLALLCLVLAGAAFASPPKVPLSLVENFSAYCAGNPGRPDKTIAFAQLEELHKVEPEILIAFGPQTPAISLEGWYLKNEENDKIILAVSTTDIDGELTATCTVFSNKAYEAEVLVELENWVALPISSFDQNQFGSRMRIWRIEIFGDPVRLIVSNPSDVVIPGVALGIISKLYSI
jgi:hypothetical protein